jgi:hypothetical protein
MGKNSNADQKFLALRRSGFKGPIDHKGDPVMTEIDKKGNPRPLFGKSGGKGK